MILKFGSYAHAAYEAAVRIARAATFSDEGESLGYEETWTINGRLHADTQGALTTAIQALETAYQTGGKDLILYLSDGTTETAHKLTTASTLYGTKVKSIEYPNGEGAEYSTYRSYQIVVSGEKLLQPGNQSSNASYQENISYRGTGGPRFVMREMRNGLPLVQRVSEYTPIVVVQSGSASNPFTYPAPNAPLMPALEQESDRTIDRRENTQGGKTTYDTSWTYVFLATIKDIN